MSSSGLLIVIPVPGQALDKLRRGPRLVTYNTNTLSSPTWSGIWANLYFLSFTRSPHTPACRQAGGDDIEEDSGGFLDKVCNKKPLTDFVDVN